MADDAPELGAQIANLSANGENSGNDFSAFYGPETNLPVMGRDDVPKPSPDHSNLLLIAGGSLALALALFVVFMLRARRK